MKAKFIWIGIIIVFVLVGGFLLYNTLSEGKETQTTEQTGQLWTCGMHPEVLLPEPGNCPICGMKLVPVKGSGAGTSPTATGQETGGKEKKERKILYWRAPMDPTEIYDHPGKSKMGMDLIPVYEDEAALGAGGTITIDPVTVQNMGIRTATVQRMPFTRLIRTVGKIDYNEENLFTVSPKISGWIEKLYVDYTGKLVKKGEPLLEIYSPELVTTQEEYLLAYNNWRLTENSRFPSIREGAESLLASARKRLLYWDILPSEIEQLEKTGQVRKTLRLYSPTDGVVVHKNAVEGVFVKEGSNLYQIADLSTVWIYASIYDYELPWIQLGQEARVELSYLPEKTFTGKIIYIYPYLNEKARDVRVRMEFANPDLHLKPGMFANVVIQGRTIPDALVIPSEAVIRSGERDLVFVVREKGKFEPRQVRIAEEGGPNNAYVRVISGLLEGETIVTSAQFLLDSESRLQEAIQKMILEKQKQVATPEKEQKERLKEMQSEQTTQHDHQQHNHQ